MEAGEYGKMARLQSEHWWFEVKRAMARAVLARYAGGSRPSGRVLEIGCGTGAMVPAIASRGRVVAVDLFPPALAYVSAADRVAADALRLPFEDETFDLVACFDLLYHRNVPDVAAALDEIARVIAPGGQVLITDSASPMLYGSHDAAHHGARRFRKADLVAQVERAGLDAVHASYFHTAVFPLVAVSRLGGRWLRRFIGRPEAADGGRSQLQPSPRWVSAFMKLLYGLEVPLAARVGLPFGVSVVLLAQRVSRS